MGRKLKGIVTPSGYKITPKKYKELQATVRNYNARLKAATKRYADVKEYLPEPVKLKGLLSQIGSGRDVTRKIKQLESMRGTEFQVIQVEGALLTRGEYRIFKENVQRENRKRARRLKVLKELQTSEGRFPAEGEEEFYPLTGKIKNREAVLKNIERGNDAYFQDRFSRWRENYINLMLANRENAILNSAYTDAVNLIDIIIKLVRSVDDNTFGIGMRIVPEVSFDIWYGERSLEQLHEILEGWKRAIELAKEYKLY